MPCFGRPEPPIRERVLDFWREWEVTVGPILGDRGPWREDNEERPNGLLDMDICRRNEGRQMVSGVGITTPSRFAW